MLVLSWVPRAFARVIAFGQRLQQHDYFPSIERFNWKRRLTTSATFVAIDGFITIVVAAAAVVGVAIVAAIIGACSG